MKKRLPFILLALAFGYVILSIGIIQFSDYEESYGMPAFVTARPLHGVKNEVEVHSIGLIALVGIPSVLSFIAGYFLSKK